MICPKCGPDCGCRAVAAPESESECDQCDGSGVYFIDGDPQECICTGSQTQKQTNLGRIILRLAACIVSREEIIKALNSKKVEVERLRTHAEAAEAKVAVMGGEWCAENRSQGRGPCGACAWCCEQQKRRAEAAEARVAQQHEALEWFADASNYHTGDLPSNREADLIREHTARARKALADDARNRAVFGVGLRGKPGE